MEKHKVINALVRGEVQGVGYRYWAKRNAEELGLKGYVRNRSDGSVELMLSGEERQIADMLERLRRGPRSAVVSDVQSSDSRWTGMGFNILPTE